MPSFHYMGRLPDIAAGAGLCRVNNSGRLIVDLRDSLSVEYAVGVHLHEEKSTD
jgi:hypothetical protein